MNESAKGLIQNIETLGAAALAEIQACADLPGLEELRIRHIGKKSELNTLLRGLKDVSPEERPEVGQVANRVKNDVEWAVAARAKDLESTGQALRLTQETLDVTLPGRPLPKGRLHPLTLVLQEIEDIFISMGFEVASGPDIEDEFHNFEALNMPADHPARDMQDTFYLQGGGVLRTHTSPVQIRAMRSRKPPLAMIAPGKVYRCDADQTHSPMFHQVEGFLIDSNVRFSDLKGVLGQFLRRMMGPDSKVRFRPSYFPFTEPSAEVDILWHAPGREPTWLEVLGAGMIHPRVLEAGGYDPEKVSGFAFGMGAERFAMLKYGLSNINHFYENDLRFLGQFA